uniref:Cytochrome P450 monooxygenase AKT7 ) n=1 Tax=Ganoderma boninense TaxID=34458 RepID=A0A5K1K499_9APHY|nr:Cytochrome P450 monooxygenase AKT7 (EC (AK-toxin biosynthesis protein 7) [Ganoderma boninense]
MAKTTSLWLSYMSSTGKRYLILDDLHSRYGPFVRIGPDTLSINSPGAVPVYNNAEKSEMYRCPGHHVGVTSLFFKFKPDDIERHRARRHIWSRMFAPDTLASLAPPLERRTVQLLMTLEHRQAESSTGFVDLYETIYHWAYEFMGDMVFGGCSKIELMKEGDPRNLIQIGRRSLAMLDYLGQSAWLVDVLWHLPFTGRMRIHHKNTAEMMGDRVKAGDLPGYRDLASYLIEGGVSWDDLQAESVVAAVGGSDSTSVMATFAIYFLLSNPECYRRLRTELDQAFPDPVSSLSLNVLASLVFLNGVINETLRLAPSPYFHPCVVPPGGWVVDGKHIPEGTIFAIASYSQHISPENFWPSPLEFLPNRWQPNGLGPETRTNRTMLTSFAYGRHACNGRGFAYHQMRMALARLLLALEFELPGDFDAAKFRSGIVNIRTTFLQEPLYVKVTRRHGVDLEALENAVA